MRENRHAVKSFDSDHRQTRSRKIIKKNYIVVILVMFLVFGMLLGIGLQKYYGVGNLLYSLEHFYYRLSWKSHEINLGVPEGLHGKLSLFILAGQSNMSGRGDLPKRLISRDADPNIYVFGNDYRWKIAVEPIDDPQGQVDQVSLDRWVGVSPALAFAKSLVTQSSIQAIGLIPCAMADTSIDQWQRNLSEDTLYGSCLKRVGAASIMGKVTAILWFQGEADAVAPALRPDAKLKADRWGSKFTVLINDWRSDLSIPNLPIVFAQLGINTQPHIFKYWSVIQAQQRQVQLPFSAMITTDDLALKDTVHFTTESYRTIGRRYADAYLELIDDR